MNTEWISVKDLLPDNNTDVLVVFINSAGTHVGQTLFKDDAFYFISETPNGYYEEVCPIPTYWMLLPKPPTS